MQLPVHPGQGLLIHAHPVVGDADEQQLGCPLQVDFQVAGADLALRAVDDAVLQNGLHGQLGQAAVVNFLPLSAVALNGELEALGKAVLLDLEVGLAVLQLLLHRHQVLHLADGVAEKAGQGLGHLCQGRQPGYQGLAADTLQGVVEKMGVDLILQGQILGLAFVQLHQLRGIRHPPQVLQRLAAGGSQEDRFLLREAGMPLQRPPHLPFQAEKGPDNPHRRRQQQQNQGQNPRSQQLPPMAAQAGRRRAQRRQQKDNQNQGRRSHPDQAAGQVL